MAEENVERDAKRVKQAGLEQCPHFKSKTDGELFCHYKHLLETDKPLHELCPAFEGGKCPFTDETHSLSSLTREELAAKCPKFRDESGAFKCPWDKEGASGDVHKCPVFSAGCPYKVSHAEAHGKCPVDYAALKGSEGKCPVDHDAMLGLKAGEAPGVGKCPHFDAASGGCPYKHLLDAHVGGKLAEVCPAFTAGCPWSRGDQDALGKVDEEKLREMCPQFKEGCPWKHVVQEHKVEGKDIADCSAFANGCPFKAMHQALGTPAPAPSGSGAGDASASAGKGKCPVDHKAMAASAASGGKCPIDHKAFMAAMRAAQGRAVPGGMDVGTDEVESDKPAAA